jgi:hypothetical protein
MNESQPKNQKVDLKTEVPGPKSKAFRAREDKYLAPGLQGFALMAGITVEKASGSTVTDVDGNTFIDIIGGIGVNGLGDSKASRERIGWKFHECCACRAFRKNCRKSSRARSESHATLFGRVRSRRECDALSEVSHRQIRIREFLGRFPWKNDGYTFAHGF